MRRQILNCDTCGKQVKKLYYVSIGNVSLFDYEKEICKDCSDKIKQHIEMLIKEVNNNAADDRTETKSV